MCSSDLILRLSGGPNGGSLYVGGRYSLRLGEGKDRNKRQHHISNIFRSRSGRSMPGLVELLGNLARTQKES